MMTLPRKDCGTCHLSFGSDRQRAPCQYAPSLSRPSHGVNSPIEGDRYEARREIAALIESWAATRNIGEIDVAFAAENVCWSRYQSVKEMVLNDPACSEENPLFVRREQAGIGEILMPGSPLDFTGLTLG